jgi:ABC-type antimicrobial peptide transport system permease subunit
MCIYIYSYVYPVFLKAAAIRGIERLLILDHILETKLSNRYSCRYSAGQSFANIFVAIFQNTVETHCVNFSFEMLLGAPHSRLGRPPAAGVWNIIFLSKLNYQIGTHDIFEFRAVPAATCTTDSASASIVEM